MSLVNSPRATAFQRPSITCTTTPPKTSPSPQPSAFSTLSALAFGGDVHLYITAEAEVLAALRLPPSPR
ncbi:hypothetical protein V501_07877 [Pseudogymnoascus sp. VKM F-4519 (FW-2642)]|nr:hypothetical protein V501_07877 [Pseudogymnoascus sp. VKM F-4519 (FW-2642)]